MKTSYLIIFLAVCSACGSVSNPDEAVNNLDLQPGISEAQVDSVFQTLRYFPDQTQLSIALISDSTVTFYGAIMAGDSVGTIKNETSVFEIGSLSKIFTSALLADLVVENKLELDQPIKEYLNFPLRNSPQFTFKELANHTSGLPRIPHGFIWESIWHMDNPYKDFDEDKLREYMSNEMELNSDPGASLQYSNIGAGILGYTLTQVEGKSYEEMLQQRLFDPLEMKQSTTNKNLVADNLVAGLTKRGSHATNWDLGAIPGAGAILSSSEDLAKFSLANFNPANKTLNLQHQQTFSSDESSNLALGWFIIEQDSTQQWLWHNGGTGGYRSSMVLDIVKQNGVVILSNISAGHSHSGKIDDLSFILLNQL